MKFKITAFLLLLSATILSVNAQGVKTIKGIVKSTDGSPISGAVISVKESNQTANTDNEGKFEMNINRKNVIHLVCSSMGFNRVEKQLDLSKEDTQNLLFTMEGNSTALDEVIVTANKRETKLQKTPVAVSVISAKEMEQRKIMDMSDLVLTVPNLITMQKGSPTTTMMSIRGIVTFAAESTVGINVDGIPLFDGFGSSLQLQDIERVEVLRGPQGTLYGRNALAGVINIFTKQPGNTLKGFAEVGFGKYNVQEYRAGISSPVIKDKLFVSVNGFYNSRKGVYTNEYTGKKYDDYKNYGGNFWLKYLANDRLSFVLNSKVERNNIIGALPWAPNPAYAFAKPYMVNQNGRNLDNRIVSTTSLLAKYQFDKWELTSLTGFNYLNDKFEDNDQDFSPRDIRIWNIPVNPKQTWTQEFKITSQNLGKWNITGGLFGFLDNQKFRTDNKFGKDAPKKPTTPVPPFIQSIVSKQHGKGFAAYAHVTYDITKEWKITGGIRYDYDEKELATHNEIEKKPMPVMIKPTENIRTSYNAISPKLNLAYLPTEDITVYVNYAKGFRPGGVNKGVETKDLSYKPEYTDNYEIGIKTEWLQHRLRANFAAFYTYWKDQQQTIKLPEPSRIMNVGDMYSRGLELEVSAVLIKNLQINYNFGIVNTKYDKLIFTNEDGTANKDYKGNKQIFTPDFTSSLSVTYSGKITKDLSFFIVPDWKYLGKQYMNYYNDLIQNPFSLLNADAGLKYKKVELKFWGKNLTDSRYISFAHAPVRRDSTPTLLGLPTTYGISAKVTF